MMTVEKLFVQIFERKNSIIQQVKQQTDLYSQHLASKLLIEGISPPPWLWNPNQSSDVQKALNKEELISKILLPRPQPAVHFSSAHCSLCNKPVVAGDNGELLDGLSKDIYCYNRGDVGDRQAIAASCHDNNTRCTLNSAPEQDLSVNSPQDETEVRISNIYTAPDQSLARIQRSRSRQKALKHRYSGKPEVRSRSSQKNVSVGSSARNRWSIFGSEKVDKVNDSKEWVEPCVIRCESCGVGESNKGGNRNNEKAIGFYTGKCKRLKNSAEESSPGMGFLKLDSCSDNIQKNDSSLVQHEEDFSKCADHVNEAPETINTSDVTADSCGEARAENCWDHKEKGTDTCDGRSPEPSSSQQPCCLNEGLEVDASVHSAKADGGIVAHSVKQLDNANHSQETAKPFGGLTLKRARSKTTSNDEGLRSVSYTSSLGGNRDETTHSSSTQKPLKANEVHRNSDGEAIMPCPHTRNISHQERNIEAVNANGLISHDLVKDPLLNSRSIIDHDGSECLVSKLSSDCLKFVEPKQLDFDDSEECNLHEHFSLNLENRRLEKSPKKAFGTPSYPQVTSDDFNNRMPQKPSSAEPDISNKAEEFCRDSFESTSDAHVNNQLKEYSSHTNERPILENHQEDSEIVLHVQSTNFEHQTDIRHSNAFESSDTENQISHYCKEGGQYRTKGKVKSTSASHASKREHLMMDYNMGENDLVTCCPVESPLGDYQNHNLSLSEVLKFGKESQSFKVDSWPRTKRRKIEDEETDSCSAPPSYSVRKQYCSQTDHKSVNLEKVGGDVETVLEYASPTNESTNKEMEQNAACQLIDEMNPSTKLQNGESALCSGGLNEHLGSSFSSNFQQVEVPIFSGLAEEAAIVSQECLLGELEVPDDLRKDNDEKDKVLGNLVNAEGLTCIKRTILEGKSYMAEDGQLSHYLDVSPYKRDLELIGVDQSLPELEGFIIDSQTENEEVKISGNQINFDELDLPRTSIERASILEQICKSASQQDLSAPFSSSFKLHGSQKPYQSVPDGLLECIDPTRISALNKDVYKQVRSNSADVTSGSLQVLSYSDCLPYSRSQFGWDSHNPYASPVGKLWGKMPLHTGSSGKTLSSNPELMCFPIEEDPSGTEENENVGEMSDKIQEDIVSSINTSAKREPLADMTEACLNAPSPVAVTDKFLSKGSGNSVSKEANFNDTQRKAKRKVGNHGGDKSLAKENDILSFEGNGIKKSEASLNSRFSKVNSSCKTNSRRERKKLSEKEPRRNNIVSNVTSFIPLVQQKQAAAQCKGKRDIKVKALEAAEAAKRLEEKKENERKMRKEALKLERARLEQENLRQMELDKKMKEEERKKKDADIVAKKRQREGEEKKEKKRKRKRLEEARQQQREDGKFLFEKVEKAKQHSMIGENDNEKKEANHESKRSQVLSKESRDNISLEKPETNLKPNGFVSHIQDAGISLEACRTYTDSCDHRKAISAFNKSPKTDTLTVKEIQQKSYEISPYQCSDDEEEEEEEEDIPNKKFIPSWTSKSCVALVLPLQQGIEPDVIFPPDSFCSTDEVLLPRKSQHKHLAL